MQSEAADVFSWTLDMDNASPLCDVINELAHAASHGSGALVRHVILISERSHHVQCLVSELLGLLPQLRSQSCMTLLLIEVDCLFAQLNCGIR